MQTYEERLDVQVGGSVDKELEPQQVYQPLFLSQGAVLHLG